VVRMKRIGDTPAPKKKPAANVKFDSGASGITHFIYNEKPVDLPFLRNEICKFGGLKGDPMVNTLHGKYDGIMVERSESNCYAFRAFIGNGDLKLYARPMEKQRELLTCGKDSYEWFRGYMTPKVFRLTIMDLFTWGNDGRRGKEFWNNCIRFARVLIENNLPGTLLLDTDTKELMRDIVDILENNFKFEGNGQDNKLETLLDLAQQKLITIK
jgi:hypothetical protein